MCSVLSLWDVASADFEHCRWRSPVAFVAARVSLVMIGGVLRQALEHRVQAWDSLYATYFDMRATRNTATYTCVDLHNVSATVRAWATSRRSVP